MSRDRYVILGLGRPRSPWFGNVALWTTAGAVPAEFHKCLSAADVRRRLSSLQLHSALIVEEGIADLDRDLIETARRANTPTFVISNSNEQEWLELGAASVLPGDLTPALLLQTLTGNATIISTTRVDDADASIEHITERQGRLIAVTGPGGTGASTIAIALAQAAASDVTEADHVALVDFARNSEQAMLHDSPDISPSVEELVELHRHRRPNAEQVREITYGVEQRGYRLLLGQRRIGAWTAMPPVAIASAINGLRRTFRTVIADITADFEGENEGGSIDIEERNALSRVTISQADLVVVVGTGTFKGIHALTRTMRQLVSAGVDEERIIPVIARSPKKGLERAEITKAITALSNQGSPSMRCITPIFLPDKPVENALRDGIRLPKQIVVPLRTTIDSLQDRLQSKLSVVELEATPEQIVPGSLGATNFNHAVGE
jgi:MinD-like ATPase involved in chromosome partitioning or flagellar assembly